MSNSQKTLSAELHALVDELDGHELTMGLLIDRIGDRGFGLLILLLALPAALPIPAPGYATPFGLLIMSLSVQMIRGRQTPWFPERIRARTIPHKALAFSVKNGTLPLRVVEFLVRPRLSKLAQNRTFLAGVAFTMLLMSMSMSLPIPLTNTAPSFVIFVLAAGMLEEDGLLLSGGLLLAPIAIGIAGLAIYTAATLGPDAVEETVKPMIKGLLGQ